MHARSFNLSLVLVLIAASTTIAQESAKIGERVGKLRFTDIRSLPHA